MDPSRTTPVALAEQRMAWLEYRQRVLAQNVANADTPGYRSRELRPFADALARAGGAAAGLARTDVRHIAPGRDPAPARVDRRATE